MSERFEIGDDRVRFLLGERWGAAPMIGWLGMNPSTAGAAKTDPTWSTWRKFATGWGFGGQIACNPVPLRSPDPDVALMLLRDIANGRDAWAAEQMEINLAHLRENACRPVAWVVGWGDKGAAMNATLRCHRKALDALSAGGARTFLSLGLTAGLNPKHILARGKSRIPDDAALREWAPNWRAPGKPIDIGALIRATA